MFSVDETLVMAAADGARRWIDAENVRRGGLDNITMLVDVMWDESSTGTYFDYAAALMQCPDNADVMLLQGASSTGLDVVNALRVSQLEPKAVLGLNPATQFYYGSPAQVQQAAGWVVPLVPQLSILHPTLAHRGGVFINATDAATGYALWRAGSQSNVTQSVYCTAYINSWAIAMAALTTAQSLSPSDLRSAFLSLNGEVSILGPLRFNNVTGLNDAAGRVVAQANRTGGFNLSAPLEYPYNWPWDPVVAGDLIVSSLNGGPITTGTVISVVGAWVASIIVEQAVFVRRKGGWWQAWLAVVACSLGGVAVWCAMLMTSTAMWISKTGKADALDVRFALAGAFLGLLPAIVLCYAGLVVLIGDVENSRLAKGSRASQAQQLLREQKEAKKKRSALNFAAHCIHLLHSISWRVIVGGLLVAAALPLTRLTLSSIWVVTATNKTPGWVWAVTLILDAVLVPTAMLIYFHALRYRVAGVFLFALCVMQDWLIDASAIRWYYALTAPSSPSAVYSAEVAVTSVQLLADLIAAATCLIFIGLQFSRMRLSRNGLTVLVASLEQTTHQLKSEVARGKDTIHQQRHQLDVVSRFLDFITLNTPLPTEYAFALSHSSTYSTFQSSWSSAAVSGGAHPSGASTKGSLVRRASNEDRASQPNLRMARPSSQASITRSSQSEGAFLPSQSHGQTADVEHVMDSGDHAPVGRSRTSTASVAPAPPDTTRPGLPVEEQTGSSSVKVKGASSEQAEGYESSTRSRKEQRKEWKQYEEELCAVLEQQLQWKEEQVNMPPSPSNSAVSPRRKTLVGVRSSTTQNIDDKVFALTMPLLGKQATDLAAQVPPAPSLTTLLSHPVCLELVKAELQQIHSVENLVFYLHAQRYRQLTKTATRRALAVCIYEQFIKAGAPQEINIDTRQREAITRAVLRKGDDGCGVELFRDAEREVLQLMETNVMKMMQGSAVHRLCSWVLATMPLSELIEVSGRGEGEEGGHSLLTTFRDSLSTRNLVDKTGTA